MLRAFLADSFVLKATRIIPPQCLELPLCNVCLAPISVIADHRNYACLRRRGDDIVPRLRIGSAAVDAGQRRLPQGVEVQIEANDGG
jgi:hypothetical protein